MKLLAGAVVLLGITCSPGYATLLYTSATTGVYKVNSLAQVPPGCVGSTVVGTAYASSSLGCVVNGLSYSAFAVAQSGIGPLGIGVSAAFNPGPCNSCFGGGFLNPYAGVQATWSGTVIPTGGSGNGFIQFDFVYLSLFLPGGPNFISPQATFNGAGLCSSGSYPPQCSTSPLFPVVFGTPYSLNLSAGYFLDSECIGCGNPAPFGVTITGAQLYNANGTPLLNGSFVVTPEPASVLLLLTMVVAGWLLSLKRRQHKPHQIAPPDRGWLPNATQAGGIDPTESRLVSEL